MLLIFLLLTKSLEHIAESCSHGCVWNPRIGAEEAGDESVSGILGYGEKTVEVSTAQDLVAAVDQKHDITVLLRGDVTVTDSAPVFTGLVNDGPCWGGFSPFQPEQLCVQSGNQWYHVGPRFCTGSGGAGFHGVPPSPVRSE